MQRLKKVNGWMWKQSELAPEIAKLVGQRPYLVVPFTDFGHTPREFAKKKNTTVVGSPTWVDDPFIGPGMKFANPTVSTPSDYLNFTNSLYPASNGAAVPHSVAVLWKATSSTNTAMPFCISSGGSGVFFYGDTSSGFSVVHGGVIAFTSLGTFKLVADTPYLFLYSYDQVTMNFGVLNLKTNQWQSQAVAETRAITSSLVATIANKGSNECLQGTVFGVAWVRGAWTANEMDILRRNPTGLWRPDPKRQRLLAKSGGVSTYTHVGSGGLQLAGAAINAVQKAMIAAGGLLLGGGGLISVVRRFTGAGGLQLGGAGTANVRLSILPTGGLQLSGASVVARKLVTTGAGGLTLSGVAPKSLRKTIVASGGLQLAGAAVINQRLVVVPTGGLLFAGAADITVVGTHVVVGSGGLQLGGAATLSLRKVARTPTGGLTLAGAAPVSRVFKLVASGGLSLAGGATLARQLRFIGAGGLQLAGSASAIQISANLAAFTGVVTIVPQFSGTLEAFAQFDGSALAFAQLGGTTASNPSFAGSVDIKPE